MTPTRAEVLDWVQDWTGRSLSPVEQADLLRATTTAGDSLVIAFAARFGVDLTGYRPRMHDLGGQVLRPDWPLPVVPPHGVAVPLSVSLLSAAAQAGRWPVTYPDLPAVRDPSAANVPLLAVGLVAVTLLVLWALPRLF